MTDNESLRLVSCFFYIFFLISISIVSYAPIFFFVKSESFVWHQIKCAHKMMKRMKVSNWFEDDSCAFARVTADLFQEFQIDFAMLRPTKHAYCRCKCKIEWKIEKNMFDKWQYDLRSFFCEWVLHRINIEKVCLVSLWCHKNVSFLEIPSFRLPVLCFVMQPIHITEEFMTFQKRFREKKTHCHNRSADSWHFTCRNILSVHFILFSTSTLIKCTSKHIINSKHKFLLHSFIINFGLYVVFSILWYI